MPHTDDFSSTPGRGVTATVEGVQVRVGAPALLADLPEASAEQLAEAKLSVTLLEEAGRTAVVVVADGAPVGVLALADRVRPGRGRQSRGWPP